MNLFLYSVINTQPRQLIYRLKYIVKRKTNIIFSGISRIILHQKSKVHFETNKNFNLMRQSSISNTVHKREDLYNIKFLNESRTFKLPFDWHRTELNKGTRLWKLNLHYMEYLSGCSDKDFQLLVNDWIDSNPPYMKDYALDNWNSYALSIRVIIWMQEYTLREERLSNDFKNKLLSSLYQQMNFLFNNPELDIGGNHIIKNIKALLWAGNFINSVQSEKWLDKGEKLLEREMYAQILDDGMHYELSPAYHCQVAMDLMECFDAIRYKPLRKKLFDILTKMIQVIADLSMQDGFIAQFSDGGYHMAASPADCIDAWRRLTNREIQQRSVFSLPAAGYYGVHRKGIDLIIDCGKLGADNLPAHGHGDIFSFELCLDGKRFIIDTGVFEYNEGKRRKYARSTRAHNTVTLDNNDQGEFYSAFRLGRRAKVSVNNFSTSEEGFELIAEHDGFNRLKNQPLHQRKFRLYGKNLFIEDTIIGGKLQIVKSRLLIHPDCTIKANKNLIQIAYKTSELLIMSNSEISVRDSVWYPDFGVENSCKQLEFSYGLAPCRGEITITMRNKIEEFRGVKESIQNNLI